jgi:hypothetical protein
VTQADGQLKTELRARDPETKRSSVNGTAEIVNADMSVTQTGTPAA